SRIARELHDIQAHALSALSVQLKVIDALVEDGADPGRVRASVRKADELARQGLVETRTAVLALREEESGLGDLLAGLAEDYQDRDGETAALDVTGTPAPLPSGATMTLYRAAQEALTNVRKHAAGARVTLTLDHR